MVVPSPAGLQTPWFPVQVSAQAVPRHRRGGDLRRVPWSADVDVGVGGRSGSKAPRRRARVHVSRSSPDEASVRSRMVPPMPALHSLSSSTTTSPGVDATTSPGRLAQAVHPHDQSECILCEGCVDICVKCIHLVKTSSVEEAVNTDQPGVDPSITPCSSSTTTSAPAAPLCVDHCPTGATISARSATPSRRRPAPATNAHGYGYGTPPADVGTRPGSPTLSAPCGGCELEGDQPSGPHRHPMVHLQRAPPPIGLGVARTRR